MQFKHGQNVSRTCVICLMLYHNWLQWYKSILCALPVTPSVTLASGPWKKNKYCLMEKRGEANLEVGRESD